MLFWMVLFELICLLVIDCVMIAGLVLFVVCL